MLDVTPLYSYIHGKARTETHGVVHVLKFKVFDKKIFFTIENDWSLWNFWEKLNGDRDLKDWSLWGLTTISWEKKEKNSEDKVQIDFIWSYVFHDTIM